ncbi:MAG: ATP-binding protein [Methylococcales bacterium]
MPIAVQFSSSHYPGLRSFRDHESDIFFGRDRQIDQLLTRLAHGHFLAVVGASGCGKSSLVKAGMLPALRTGFVTGAGSRWRICDLRPGDRPLGWLVIAVTEAFRRPDCCFLAAPEGPLQAGTLLDISHESLIRQGGSLAGWVAAEAESAEMYGRLGDWALRWERGNAELWRGPDLGSALAWRHKEKPSPAWAERYGGRDRFEISMRFLDASEAARRAAAAAEEARCRAQLRRIRRLAWGFGLTTAGLALAALFYCIA